jgi:Putative peptidoglycan binding domain
MASAKCKESGANVSESAELCSRCGIKSAGRRDASGASLALCLLAALGLNGCTTVGQDPNILAKTTVLKNETLTLMDKAIEPYSVHTQQEFSYILLDAVQVAQISKDPDTLTPLLLRCGSVESALPGGHADLIKTLQTALKQAGLYNEEPDGKFGERTAEAVAEFQKRNVGAVYVDAVVGPPTGMALLKNNGSWSNV